MTVLTRDLLKIYQDLDLDSVASPPGRLYAGFVPDFDTDSLFTGLDGRVEFMRSRSDLYTERRIYLRSSDGSDSVRLSVFVGNYGAGDARFALAESMLSIMRSVRAEDPGALGPQLGDFTRVEFNGQDYGFIAFGQNNVVVSMFGLDPRVDLRAQAEALSAQLAASPEYSSSGLATLRPQISSFYINRRRVDVQSGVPLIVQARCPSGLPLEFDFEASHGSVEALSRETALFRYRSGLHIGPTELRVRAQSPNGLSANAMMQFSVGVGDLGYGPGFRAEGLLMPLAP